MTMNYNDYLTEGTKAMQEFLSSTCLDEEEKASFADAFVSELANNISDTNKLRDYNYIFNVLYIRFIGEKLNKVLVAPDATTVEIDDAIALCDEYKQLFNLFDENNWKLPKLRNSSADDYKDQLIKKQNAKLLAHEIKNLDNQINQVIVLAKKDIDTQKCNEAIQLLNELDVKLKTANRNKVVLPEIQNKEPQQTVRSIIEFRKKAVQKEALHQRIKQVDDQLTNLFSLGMIDKEHWPSIIELSDKQLGLLAECDKNRWPRPVLKTEKLKEINNQYNHYRKMVDNDIILINDSNALKDKGAYKRYIDLCRSQQRNIETCKINGWSIPDLVYPDPAILSVSVMNEQIDNEDRAKRSKKLIISAILSVVVVGCFFFVRQQINKGKIEIPFDSTYTVGQSSELIYSELETAGFTNITKQQDTSGWLESGLVTGVSADNSNSYKKGKYLKPDASIVINISSENRIEATEFLKNWQTENYKEFQEQLKEKGFTNITIIEEETNEKKKDDSISSLTVNGLDYVNEYCFIPEKAPIVITCYSLKITIGNSVQEFIGQDYEEVVSNLKEYGFIDVKTEKINAGMAKGNTVVDLTVNSVNTYKKTDSFDPEVKIVVKYSSNDRLNATDILENWKNKKYQDTLKALKDRGFTNINVEELETDKAIEDNSIAFITINENLYEIGDCYVQKDTPISIIYQKYKIAFGYASDGLSKLKYTELVASLKERGFKKIKLLRNDDLKLGLLTSEGSIASVSINDTKKFTAEDTFYPDDQITIVVNTFKGRGCDDITEVAD